MFPNPVLKAIFYYYTQKKKTFLTYANTDRLTLTYLKRCEVILYGKLIVKMVR